MRRFDLDRERGRDFYDDLATAHDRALCFVNDLASAREEARRLSAEFAFSVTYSLGSHSPGPGLPQALDRSRCVSAMLADCVARTADADLTRQLVWACAFVSSSTHALATDLAQHGAPAIVRGHAFANGLVGVLDEAVARAEVLSAEFHDMTGVSETSRQLTECAVTLLPAIERAEYGELFRSDLVELAGGQCGRWAQLWHSLRVLIGIPSLRLVLREDANPARERSW
ncbi:hypothetical protein [Amycolatopsis sp. cmx-8-4]|uniref:hypothetical protein n=1 Tax=Amycolatopsis sp. cmx-8-4 TaxID=2790947 RepID=UPI00397D88B7